MSNRQTFYQLLTCFFDRCSENIVQFSNRKKENFPTLLPCSISKISTRVYSFLGTILLLGNGSFYILFPFHLEGFSICPQLLSSLVSLPLRYRVYLCVIIANPSPSVIITIFTLINMFKIVISPLLITA